MYTGLPSQLWARSLKCLLVQYKSPSSWFFLPHPPTTLFCRAVHITAFLAFYTPSPALALGGFTCKVSLSILLIVISLGKKRQTGRTNPIMSIPRFRKDSTCCPKKRDWALLLPTWSQELKAKGDSAGCPCRGTPSHSAAAPHPRLHPPGSQHIMPLDSRP